MLKELSIFTGSADIELALGLVAKTAGGHPRTDNPTLEELAKYFTSDQGRTEVCNLAERLGVELTLPATGATAQMFADELLSSRALELHRGRNVYGAGKAQLWHELWVPFLDALAPDDDTLELTKTLVGLRTNHEGSGIADCVDLLRARLSGLGFGVEVISRSGHAPFVLARRDASGGRGTVVMYGHYDVETPDLGAWNTDPWQLTEDRGRLYGVGIGDNKAALAHRLCLLENLDETPEIVWVIQGEEEIGSPLAHEIMQPILHSVDPVAWIEENGYFDPDGTQRMIARRIGVEPDSSAPPDAGLWRLIEMLAADARIYGLDHRVECRGLQKAFFETGCPFNRAIPKGGRYVAFGVNDPESNIHRPNESVPMWTFPVHARQFRTVLTWASEESQR